ncbi:MAG: insulinase family protein, partial [Rubripirellula sp.]|nr:insulinase family protein [Rubripirellula sp.]
MRRVHSASPVQGVHVLLVLLVAFATSAGATALRAQETQQQDKEATAMVTKVTEVEGISEYRLENGVRVLLFPDPSKEVVTVNMTVFVGSRHEGYGEAGMAHLLEHMLFKGTPTHPDIPKALKDRGAGRSMNGTTWMDRTNYYETLPATGDNL